MAASIGVRPTRTSPTTVRRRLTWVLAGLAAVLVLAAAWLYWPENPAPLQTEAYPSATYGEALRQVGVLARATSAQGLNPLCELRLLDHGQRQPRVIVLVHGYTDCPEQFAALGDQFFARGYNVVIAPLPRHGLADRLTESHRYLTAEELAAHAGALVDLAQGLGEEVTVMGLSGGAMVAGWAAQTRADLDQAVLIAPAFGYLAVPTPLTRPAMRLYQVLPNEFRWWDPALQAEALPAHGYPRYATRALAQLLRLGDALRTAASQAAPAAGRVVVVTNASDERVNNALTASVAAQWQRQGGRVETFEFAAALGLPHDLIEPIPPHPLTADVYAQLVALVEAR